MIDPQNVRESVRFAWPDPAEQQSFDLFLQALRVLLLRPFVPHKGTILSLADYFDDCLRHGSPGGDEQPVVDIMVGELLEALGYGPAEIAYNRALDITEERAVPDFTIRLPDYLGITPVLIIEDKATSIRDFHQSSRGRNPGTETPREQLRRYVLSGAVHGRAGLLCNGLRLEAWDFGPDGDVCLVEVKLHRIAAHLREKADLPAADRDALFSLHSRFSRAAFARTHDMLTSTLGTVPLPRLWLDRIQEELKHPGAPSRIEDIVFQYHESLWQRSAMDVGAVPEQLVEALRALIEMFTSDVRQQLGDALARFEEYERLIREEERRADLDVRMKKIALHRAHFKLREEEYYGLCLRPLEEWRHRPRMELLKQTVSEITGSLDAHFRGAHAGAPRQETLLANEDGEVIPAQGGGTDEQRRKRVRESLRHEIDLFCRAALDLYAERERLGATYRASVNAAKAYGVWMPRVSSSVLTGADEETLRAEFSRQTAYVYIIRLLLVRICEDKGIFKRKLSNGGLSLWQERSIQYLDYASGRSYAYLTRMAYECAQNIYVHFYGASEIFDWYRMDDKMLLRALLVLNAFNLARIDTDIIGAVYGRYLREGKHEQGRYYTPRQVVQLMLDMVGYVGGQTVQRRLCDLACGSGSFLVEAAQRLLSRYREADGRIDKRNLQAALTEVQRSLHGVDINPFACYLAETNLLIQVLDLVSQAHQAGIHLSVDRFQIYCEDSLLVDEDLSQASDAALVLLGEDQAVTGLLKARAGRFKEGFDVLVGNPPYVRADVKSATYVQYRKEVEKQSWFTTKKQKWDLYVPFVEQYHRLLADGPDARACLITIKSLASAPYAEALRRFICQDATVHNIVFTEKLRLFTDAKWLDNIIFCFSRGAPAADHQTRRERATELAPDGSLARELLDEVAQDDPDQLFTTRPRAELDLTDTIRWDEICYVSKGMVLHAKETLAAGTILKVPASYDPTPFGEDLVEDLGKKGKRIRHRPFVRDDLVSDQADPVHTRRYLDPDQVLRGGLGTSRWLEYGPHGRCPERVDRPTFPELYDRPKIVFGTFKGVAVDDGADGGFLVVPHSIMIALRWAALVEINNRSLSKKRNALEAQGRYDPGASEGFSEWYLCALALSAPIQAWLKASKRSMKDHVFPGDIEAIPVKKIALHEQAPFIALARERHQLLSELIALERKGYNTKPQVTVPIRLLAERFRSEHKEVPHLTLFQATGKGLFRVEPAFREKDLTRARAAGATVVVGREVAARVGDDVSAKEPVARLLASYLGSLKGVFADRQTVDSLPGSESGLLLLHEFVLAEVAAVEARIARIDQIGKELDILAWRLYRPASR